MNCLHLHIPNSIRFVGFLLRLIADHGEKKKTASVSDMNSFKEPLPSPSRRQYRSPFSLSPLHYSRRLYSCTSSQRRISSTFCSYIFSSHSPQLFQPASPTRAFFTSRRNTSRRTSLRLLWPDEGERAASDLRSDRAYGSQNPRGLELAMGRRRSEQSLQARVPTRRGSLWRSAQGGACGGKLSTGD